LFFVRCTARENKATRVMVQVAELELEMRELMGVVVLMVGKAAVLVVVQRTKASSTWIWFSSWTR
jgi:hypothetical protein